MAFISLKWFAGMVPRRGNQHLNAPHATEAENCNLYSGELRPLHKPALAHRFCRPEDDCWRQPIPDDPSVPPVEPPEPPDCIPVAANGFIAFSPPVPDPVLPGTVISATVYVNSDATAPVQYQWFKNNIAIPQQVGPTLFYTVMEGDGYASFTVLVQNPCRTFLSNPITIGEVNFFCMEYECDSLANVIIGTSPDYYYPMNIQSDLNNYPIDPAPIKDYSGAATPPNHLRSQGAGEPPVSIASTWESDNCSGFMTGAPLNSTMSLETDEGDIVWGNYSGTDFSAFLQAGNYLAGDKVYFKVEWYNIASDTVNGVNAIYYTPTGSMRFEVFSTDQTNGSASNKFDYDFSQDAADWSTRMIGVIIYPEGVDLRYELYLDYDMVTTALVPVNAGQTLSVLEPDGPPFHIQACSSNAGSQELAIWYRRLNSSELLAMKEALVQNKADYVDPDPACVPCEVYECDALDTALISLLTTNGGGAWVMDDAVTPFTNLVGGLDLDFFGSPSVESPITWLDTCTTSLGASVDGGNGGRANTATLITSTEGVMGAYVNSFNADGMRVIDVDFRPGNQVSMTVAGTTVYFQAQGTQSVFSTPIPGGGAHTAIRFTVDDVTNDWTAELFIDFVYQETITGNEVGAWNVSGPQLRIGSASGTGGVFVQYFMYTPTMLSNADMAVLAQAVAQNKIGYVDPNPNCVVVACKEYDCNALRSAILASSPTTYWDMRDGYADISTVSGTPASGDIMYDNISPPNNNLTLILGGGNVVLPSAPGLLDNCSGTAFNANSATLRTSSANTFSPTSEGTMLAVHKDDGVSSTGSFGIDWADSSDHVYFESGMASILYNNPESGQNAFATILPEILTGTVYGVVTWKAFGGDTIITVYDADGNVTNSEALTGLIGDEASFSSPRFLQVGFLANSWQDCTMWDRALTVNEIITLGEAAKRNLSTYVDPNPDCEPAP